ncbi:GlxA family transcriptional regulator [Tardiphaga sp. 709]|jgi:transcriptional regulator GlxA family with amidase domain|uniref:GlxA family transcriptional regulator n=1 Tax=unclassified Tardiphaga TaxID=2631404 RepID=UPI0028E198DB|nr:GlxA family transcriptional regulator [Tardiphaga sp. 709]WNV10473.1 GlxA family transcriptional regulator [Tardiphaga sp. 709]
MKIGLVLCPSFQPICFGAVAAFDVANKQAGKKLYDMRILSEEGGLVASSSGMQVMTDAFGDESYDTLIVAAGLEIPTSSPGLVRLLRAAARDARRVAGICLGSFVLGDAGLLNGRRATTHWRYARALQDRFPSCRVDMDKIFLADGPIWTSAGMTAGTDLVVGIIERDHGSDVARSVAKGMVMYHRRSGGQSQHSTLLDLSANEDRVQRALNYARQNLAESLTIDDLARAASLSPRQFTRLFRSETGTTPAKAVEALRVEAAKLMLEQSRQPIEVIAREVGFANRERMRLAFARVHGEVPRAIRNEAGPLATL